MKIRHRFSNGHHGGWVPPRPDLSAKHLAFDAEFALGEQTPPDAYELPGVAQIPCIDQANEGSCTAHGTDGVVMYDELKQGEPIVVMSRAMIYWNARLPEGTTAQDSGASVADAVNGIAQYGVCTDADFPYVAGDYMIAPSDQNYLEAKACMALQAQQVAPTVAAYQAAIFSGYPVVDGMSVFSSMMTPEVAQTGIVPIPSVNDENEGGHCTYRYGFNLTDVPWTSPSGLVYPPGTFGSRNSWREPDGTWWGDQGDYFLPLFWWQEGLVSDAHIITRIGSANN